nr:MAG TPA: hypothetical protein [Bacteriophage sp.]
MKKFMIPINYRIVNLVEIIRIYLDLNYTGIKI